MPFGTHARSGRYTEGASKPYTPNPQWREVNNLPTDTEVMKGSPKEVTLYGGQKLTYKRSTKGTHVYSTTIGSREHSQYVPKEDMPQKVNAIYVVIRTAE